MTAYEWTFLILMICASAVFSFIIIYLYHKSNIEWYYWHRQERLALEKTKRAERDLMQNNDEKT
ncbi:MAG: hypothetical protein AAFR90_13445 [Pseudomonadota bacterium]